MYPWEQWLNGQVWLLRDNTDYACKSESMVGQVRYHAKKVSLGVSSRTVWGVGVMVQAYPAGSTWKPNLAAIDDRTVRKALDNLR